MPDNNSSKGLGNIVKDSLRQYFQNLDGELPDSGLYKRIICEIEKPLIELTLNITNFNQAKTADVLGLSRNTLRKKIKELSISCK